MLVNSDSRRRFTYSSFDGAVCATVLVKYAIYGLLSQRLEYLLHKCIYIQIKSTRVDPIGCRRCLNPRIANSFVCIRVYANRVQK